MRQQLTEKLKIVPITLCLFFTLLAGGCVQGAPTSTLAKPTLPPTELLMITNQAPAPTQEAAPTRSSDGSDSTCEEIHQSDSGLPGNGYLLWWRTTPEHVLTDMDGKELNKVYATWSVYISPNRDAIAYLNSYIEPKLVVSDETGSKEFNLPNVTPAAAWINDHTIRLYENFDELDSFALFLDINTGEITRLETNFPDFYMYPREVNRYWSVPAFSPDLAYAIYPSYIQDTEYLGNNLIRLGDGEVIGLFSIYVRVPPVWSPTGESFLQPYFKDDVIELYRIFADNQQAVALTNFHGTYPNFLLYSYTWSPDGEKVAAWFLEDSETSSYKSLILIDLVNNNRVILTCIQSTLSIGDLEDDIIWSPDSSQLIVRVKPGMDSETNLLWLDVEQMEYTFLDKPDNNSALNGWLNFIPPTP